MSAIRRSTRLSSVSKSICYKEFSPQQYDDNVENYNMNSEFRTPKRKTRLSNKHQQQPLTAIMNTPTSKQGKRRPRKNSSSSDLDSFIEESLHVSPPKQTKIEKDPYILLSPSRLIDRLSICDESSKRNRKVVICPKETDKDDFKVETKIEVKNDRYQNARKTLNSCETNSLPGREKELQELSDYLLDHLGNKKSGSLYISGQPGTGKTACLLKLLHSPEFSSKFIKVYINCTSMSSIGSVYKKICMELKLETNAKSEKDCQAAVETFLTSKHKMLLLVLDEIDQLCGKKQTILYTIFEWPSKPKNKILLIGIANSLDLTDRMLIRLNAKCELKPKLLHFSPYNKQQIIDIFSSRLKEANVIDVFPPTTLQLLAAKVSAVNGDVRRALDIGRRIVQLAELEKYGGKKLNLKEFGVDISTTNDDDNNENSVNDNDKIVPVQVKQVVSVINGVYGTSQALNNDIESSFPLQQKLILCSLLLILKNSKNRDVTIGRLHNVYKKICDKKNIAAVDQSEFIGLCALVDARGIVRVIGKKDQRLNRIVLQWDETEVHEALKDKQLIAAIINDVSCLDGR